MEDITIFLKVTFVHRCFFTIFKLNDGEYYYFSKRILLSRKSSQIALKKSQ